MPVIELEHVSKSYVLGASRTSLREALARGAAHLIRRNGQPTAPPLLWALDDVSFRVEQGEVLGLIGPNGAGKSTLLKLLSRVTFPTRGAIRTRGRLAALIELGAGFHPDLTGRENIYLNGSILGLKRREIDAQFSDIVEFAELDKFIDTPVKRYSSGMYVRLAFAVAAHIKADILLVDEVLAVGDAAFQQKSLAKMNELRNSGATIVFVSHNLWSVSSFCTRAILLRNGGIQAQGTPDEVIQFYRSQERAALLSNFHVESEKRDDVCITQFQVLDASGKPVETIAHNDFLTLRARYAAARRVANAVIVIHIRRADGLICCTLVSRNDGEIWSAAVAGEGAFETRIGPLPLVPDLYTVEAHIIDRKLPLLYTRSPRESFRVQGDMEDYEGTGVFEPAAEWTFS